MSCGQTACPDNIHRVPGSAAKPFDAPRPRDRGADNAGPVINNINLAGPREFTREELQSIRDRAQELARWPSNPGDDDKADLYDDLASIVNLLDALLAREEANRPRDLPPVPMPTNPFMPRRKKQAFSEQDIIDLFRRLHTEERRELERCHKPGCKCHDRLICSDRPFIC